VKYLVTASNMVVMTAQRRRRQTFNVSPSQTLLHFVYSLRKVLEPAWR
jgi:hypothetical protein